MLIKLVAQNAVDTTIMITVSTIVYVVDISAQSQPKFVVFGEWRQVGCIDGLGETASVRHILAECGKGRKIYREIQSLVQPPAIAQRITQAVGKVGDGIIIIGAV